MPDSGLDEKVFVLADMMAYTELMQGWPVVAFHGTAEWALDYIYTSEVIWIPTEEQLRNELVNRVAGPDAGRLTLQLTEDGYTCTIEMVGQPSAFPGATASEAYAAALLHLLEIQDNANHV